MASEHHASDYLHTRFLKNTALTAKFDVTAPSMKRFGVAIFGLGRAGSIHINNVMANYRLRLMYIVDSRHERLQQVREQYCLASSCQMLRDSEAAKVLADPEVCGVIVATPSGHHESLVCLALQAGKHVLCEKPVALNIAAVEKCYDMANKNNCELLCAFNRRYDPAFAEIAARARAGAVGQVRCVSTVSRDSPRPSMDYLKVSAGIFHDCIVHDVDLICFVLGEYPTKVFAAAHCFSSDIATIDDYDTVVVTMKFPSGVLAHVDVSRHAVYGYDQRLEVHGSTGLLKSDNQRPTMMTSSDGAGCTQVPIHHSFTSRYSESYTRQLDHFLALMDGSEKQVISKGDVVNVSKVLHALETSVKSEAFVSVDY